jgi:hypothetical protein
MSSTPHADEETAVGSKGWIGIVMTDWEEVGELVTDSYCAIAPKNLSRTLDHPSHPR